LIQEIFKHNEALCNNRVLVSRVVRQFAKVIGDLPLVSHRKSHILNHFFTLMKCKNRLIKGNQSQVLTQIDRGDTKHEMIYLFDGEEGLRQLDQSIKNMHIQHDSMDSGRRFIDVKISPEMYYCINLHLLNLLTVTAEGKNGFTESRCQILLTLKQCDEMLKRGDFCWPLKQALVSFLLHVYIDTEFGFEDDIATIWSILETIINDVEYFLGSITNREKTATGNIATHNSKVIHRIVTPSWIKSLKLAATQYIFDTIVPTIGAMFQRNMNINDSQRAIMQRACKVLVDLYNSTDNGLHRTAVFDAIDIGTTIPDINEILQPLNYPKELAVLPSKSGEVSSSFALAVSQSKTHAAVLLSKLTSLSKKESFIDDVEHEFEEMVVTMVNIKRKSHHAFKGSCTIQFPEIVRSLITLLDINEINLSDDLALMALKSIRKMVEMENKSKTTPAVDWDTEDWIAYEKEIVNKQNTLTDLGAVDLMVTLVAQSEGENVKMECIRVSVALLLGGNEKVQGRFLEIFEADLDNGFMGALKALCFTVFDRLKKTESERMEEMRKEANGDMESLADQVGMMDEVVHSVEVDADHQRKKNIEDMRLLLRFMQLLCEGHHSGLQNFLREQTHGGIIHGKTFDFVTYFCSTMSTNEKLINAESIGVANQLFDTLIEVVQGPCVANQRAITGTKVVDSCKAIFQSFVGKHELAEKGFEGDENDPDIMALKQKCATILLSLLEGNPDEEIYLKIGETLDVGVIRERIAKVYSHYVTTELNLKPDARATTINSTVSSENFEDYIYEGFDLYVLLKKLSGHIPRISSELRPEHFTMDEQRAYEFFQSRTCRIEVLVDDDLQHVYFAKRPVCDHLTTETRDKFMNSVNRDSANQKLMGLINTSSDLIDEMRHVEKISKKTFQITPQRLAKIRDISFMLSLLINIVMLGWCEKSSNSVENDTCGVPFLRVDFCSMPCWGNWMIFALGCCQALASATMLVSWAGNRAALIIASEWRQLAQKNKIDAKPAEDEDELYKSLMPDELSVNETRHILRTRGKDAEEFHREGKRSFGHILTTMEYYWMSFIFLLEHPRFKYYLLYIFISLMGLYISKIFYCLHLLDIVGRSPTLQNIIQAVTLNRLQLLMTGLLGIILIYIYAVVGYFFLNDYFTFGTQDQCSSMFHCFMTTINWGLRMGGGIGDVLIESHWNDQSEYFSRFLYDLSFFIFVVIILLNIIFGIIIDTFAELRDNKKNMDEDMKNVCFICNIGRYNFDKNASGGFPQHIKDDHNLWQYLFFLVHLGEKDPTEYDGIESYVASKLKTDDISWMPLMRAMSLDSLEQEEDIMDVLKNKLGAVETVMSAIANKLALTNEA